MFAMMPMLDIKMMHEGGRCPPPESAVAAVAGRSSGHVAAVGGPSSGHDRAFPPHTSPVASATSVVDWDFDCDDATADSDRTFSVIQTEMPRLGPMTDLENTPCNREGFFEDPPSQWRGENDGWPYPAPLISSGQVIFELDHF